MNTQPIERSLVIPEGFDPVGHDELDRTQSLTKHQAAGRMLIEVWADLNTDVEAPNTARQVGMAVSNYVEVMSVPDMSALDSSMPVLFGKAEVAAQQDLAIEDALSTIQELRSLAAYLSVQELNAESIQPTKQAIQQLDTLRKKIKTKSNNSKATMSDRETVKPIIDGADDIRRYIESIRSRMDSPRVLQQMLESGDPEMFWAAAGRLSKIKRDYVDRSMYIFAENAQVLDPLDKQYEQKCEDLVMFLADKIEGIMMHIDKDPVDKSTPASLERLMHAALDLCTTESGVEILAPFVADINDMLASAEDQPVLLHEPCYPNPDHKEAAIEYLKTHKNPKNLYRSTKTDAAEYEYARRYIKPLKVYYQPTKPK